MKVCISELDTRTRWEETQKKTKVFGVWKENQESQVPMKSEWSLCIAEIIFSVLRYCSLDLFYEIVDEHIWYGIEVVAGER